MWKKRTAEIFVYQQYLEWLIYVKTEPKSTCKKWAEYAFIKIIINECGS